MYRLSCAEQFKYGEEVYVLDLVPVQAGLVASSSDQILSVFDPQRLGGGPISRIRTDHGNLRACEAYESGQSVIATTGENGSVSVWDLRLDPSKAQAVRIDSGGGLC
jgi:WD repeat-containing protein 89